MAKIRFPGKALKLNTRKRVRYRGHFTATTPEEIYTRRIRQGLELFYKIFGESDEDEDDFEGFFASEILKRHVTSSKSITKRQRSIDLNVESTIDDSQSISGSGAANESNTQSTKLLRGKRKSVIDEKQQYLETRLGDVHKSSSEEAFDTVEDEPSKKYQEHQTAISENKKDVPAEETLLYKRAPRGKEIDGSSGLKTKKSNIQKVNRPPTVKTALAKKLLAKAKKKVPSVPVQAEKSPKKFILPSMSVRSSRIITPNKRLFADITEMCSTSTSLEEPSSSSSLETLSNKRSVKLTQKGRGSHTTFLSRPRSLSQPEIEPSLKIEEKDRMQETISLYTESITCQVKGKGKGQVGRPPKRRPDLLLPDDYVDMDDSPVDHKESKVKEKIEKLLRSPWDDRIKQAHGKNSKEFEEMQASAGSSLNQGSAISKGIIRKARLNLNKRTLQKIRNPVSLQRLIPTSDEGVVDGKCAFCDICEGDLSRKFGVICCSICSNFISNNSQGATEIFKCKNSKLNEPKVSPEKASDSKFSPKKFSSCIIIGTASEDRCSACWLACTLNKCAMPNLLHDRLRKRLPQHLKENIPTSLARSISNSSSKSPEKQTGDQALTMGSLQTRPLTDSGSHSVFGSLVDLPGGWRRRTQHSQVIVISPCGEKFKTIPKLEEFLRKRGINIEARFLFGNSVSPTVNTEHSPNIAAQHLCTDNNVVDQKNKVVMTTLPGGWIRRIKWRACGDKFDTFVYSPDGRTFRSKKDLNNYFVQIGKVDDIHKYFPVTTGNSSTNVSSSEQTESSGTEPIQGSSSELQSSSELGSEISSDEKVEGATDNELDSSAMSDKSLTSSGSPSKKSKEERKRALRMLKLPSEDLSIDPDKVADVKYDYPKNEIKNKRRYRSLPSSRKLCDEPGMTDTTESESEKMRTSTPLKAFRIKNRNKSKFDSIDKDIESMNRKTHLEDSTDNMKVIPSGETEEINENESIRSTTVQTKNHGKIVLKIKRKSLDKNKTNVQGQAFSQKERRHPSIENSFEHEDSVNDSSQESSNDKVETGNFKSKLMISGELVCNSSREKITTSDTGSYDGFEKDNKKNDSSAEEQEMGSSNLDVEDESLSDSVSAAKEPFNISLEVEESTLNEGFEEQNVDDESTLLSDQTEATNLLTDEPESPKLKLESPKLNLVSPKLNLVSPKLNLVSPKLKSVSPKVKSVSPKVKPISPKFKEPKSIKDTASSDDSKLSSPVISESNNVPESKRKVKLKSGKSRRSLDYVTQRFGNGWSRKIDWNENRTGKIAKLHSPDGQVFRSRIELMAYFKKAGRSKVDIDFYFPPLILRDEIECSESGIELASKKSLKDKLIPSDAIKVDQDAIEGSEISESDKPSDNQNASTDENERTPNKKLRTHPGPSIIKVTSNKTGTTPEGGDDTNMVSLSEEVQKQLSELGNRAGKVLVVKTSKKRGRPPKIASSPSQPPVETPGPRVKHVCRSQAQVLGIPRAIFPSPTKGSSPSGYVTLDVPSGKGKKRKKVVITTTACGKVLRKTQWCGKCFGCTTPNCLKCTNCLDMKKYGGPGTKKKPCSQRKCHNPRLSMASAIKAETGSSKSADVSMEQVEDMVTESLAAASMHDTPTNVQPKKNQHQQQEIQPVVSARRRYHQQQQQNPEALIQRKSSKLHRQMAAMKHQDKSVFVPHQPTRPHPDELKDLRKDIASGKEFVPGALINIDYWQEYDADDMMIKGFPIISSTPLSMEVLCFRCGSAGKDQLLFCVWCCEGIHPYCLEDGEGPETETEELWWCCCRCATCHVCGFPGIDNELLRCSDCRYYYHMECLGPAAHSNCQPQSDRPWKCVGCMRCDSCGSSGVAQWVAGATLPTPLIDALADMDLNTDIALCKRCITLREQGNFCPLCNGCYEDDDYDSKMMECGKCGEWIHALCEGLNNEHYQILSFLPDSVEYVCRGCHITSKASWLEAVTTELLAGCQSVMQSMMSMRAAKHLIKRPDTAKTTQCHTIQTLDHYKKESLLNFHAENKDKNYLVDSLITNKEILEENIQEKHSIYQSNLIENIINKEELKNNFIKIKNKFLSSIEDKKKSCALIDICDDLSDSFDKITKSSTERHAQVSSLNEISNVSDAITALEQKRNQSDKIDFSHSHTFEMQDAIHVSNIQSTVEGKTNQICSVENENYSEEIIQNTNKESEKIQENIDVNELKGDNPEQRLEKEIDRDSIKSHENKDLSVNSSISTSENINQTEQQLKESLIPHIEQKKDEISANIERIDAIEQLDTASNLGSRSVSNIQSIETSKCDKISLASKCNEDRNKEKKKSSKIYPLRKTRSSVSIRRSLPTGFKLRECSVRLNDIYKVSQKDSTTELENENNVEGETHVKSNESTTLVEKHLENANNSSCTMVSQNNLNSHKLSVTADREHNLEYNNEDSIKVLKNKYDVCKVLEKRSFRSLDASCELIKPVKEFRSDVSCSQVDFRSDVSCTQVDGPNDESSSHMEDYFRNSSFHESSSVNLDDLQNTNNPSDRETTSPSDLEIISQINRETISTTDIETVSQTDRKLISLTDKEEIIETDRKSFGLIDNETTSPTDSKTTSPTDSKTISLTNSKSASPTDSKSIILTDREAISSSDREAVSPADIEAISQADIEAISSTDIEASSPEDIDAFSSADIEIISPANKISKDIDDDCVSSEASSFCDTDTEIESIQDDPDEPKDMFTIQEKICDRKYNSVLQFHVDMTRIIENGKNFNPTQSNNVQTTYTKNMKEYFPWFDVQNANIFELVDRNRPFPIPHGDHDYAFQVGNSKNPFKLHDLSLGIKRKLSPYKQSLFCSKDNRRCVLCGREGDTDPNYCGRLLYLGQNEWLHVNCGLWSSEVYEEADGGMQNVYLAASRGRMIKCNFCQERGATVGCCHKSCSVTYHFPCAKKAHSQFMEDKRIFCPSHYNAENGKNKKDDYKVSRCVYVDMDSEKRKWKQFLGNKVNIVIGSLSISNLGRIVSESDNNEALIPLGFTCTRLYWSTVDPTQRVRYTCTTKLVVPDPDGLLISNAFHLTVDHSLSPHLVSKQMAIVNKWFKQLEHHNVEETSKKTNIIPAHLCPFYRSILDQEAANRREEILSDRESPPIVVESVVRQCIDEIVDKVSRSVEEESLLLDSEIPAIVSADDNELISMVLNDLDACDPTLTLQSTPSTSGRPSPLDIDFLNTCDQMLDKSPENGSKGSSSDDGSKEIITSFPIGSQNTITSGSLPVQCPIEGEDVQIIQKLPTSDISSSFNMALPCPPQPLSCSPQPLPCPPQPLPCPPQPMPCPPQPMPCPPQPMPCPPQSLACPQQSMSYPLQKFSCPPKPLSCPQQPQAYPPQPLACPPQPMACPPQPISCQQQLMSCPQQSMPCPQVSMSCPPQPMPCPQQPMSCPSQPPSCPSEVYPEMGVQMVASNNIQQQLTVHNLPSQLPPLSQIVQTTTSIAMQINPVKETTEIEKIAAVDKNMIPEFSITDPQKNTTPLSTFIPTPVHGNTNSSSTFSGLSTFIPSTLSSGNDNAFSTCFTNAAIPTNLSSTPSFICGSFNNEARSNNTTIINSASSNSPSSNSSNSPSSSNSSSSNSCSGSSSSGESSSPERNDVPEKLSKKNILDTSVGAENVESEPNVKEISGESTNAGDGSTSDSKCTGSVSASGSSDCSSSGSESSLSTVRVSGKQNQSSTKVVVGKGSAASGSHKQICRVLPMPASASRRSSSASDHSDQGQANISPGPTRTSSSTNSSSTSGSSSNESPNQHGSGGQESGSGHGPVGLQQHPDNGQQLSQEHHAASSGLHSSSDAAIEESPGYRSPESPSDCNQPSPTSDRDSSHHSPTSPEAHPHRTSRGLTADVAPITQDKKCRKICMKRNYKTVIKKYPLRSGMKKNKPYETVQIEINETYEIPGGRGTGFVRKSLKRKWSEVMDSEEEVMQDKSEDSKIKKEDDAANNIQCNLEEDSTSKISKKVLKFTDDDNDITVSIVNNNNLCEFGKTSRVRKYRTRTVLQLDGAADGSSSSAEMSQDEGATDGSSDLNHDEATTSQQSSSTQPTKPQSTANKERPSDYCSLAQRIKQQSLARSAPGEEGPYKCTKCKRLYRTKESYQKHVETCTFEIDSSSTSDEDEESEDDMLMDNQKSHPHTKFHETKGNRGNDPEMREHEQRELVEGHGLGSQVEKELIQQSSSDVNDEKANPTSHIGSLEHLSNIVDSVQEVDSSGDEPLFKKQRLNPLFPRQSGVHRQLRTGIFKRSGNISSLDETDEETYPSPHISEALNSDVFIPPPVSPVKFNPNVKKSMSPRRYTNVRLMRGAHGYQYRRFTTQALGKNHEQFTPSQTYINSTPQDSSQPLPSNFGQSMESSNTSYHSGESSQYCGSNTQVAPPPVPQIVTVMSAPSVAVPPGYTLQYVGSYRDGSTVTSSNSQGNSGVMKFAATGVAPSPNVNSGGVLSYSSTPVVVQPPPQLVDNDVNHPNSGGIINYPSGPVVMPPPQIIMASQQGSLMLPQVVNTNITYTFASPETLLLNQSTVVAPGMQQVQYVSQSQQQSSLQLQSNPEVVQYNPGVTVTQTQGPHVQMSGPQLMQTATTTTTSHGPTVVQQLSTGHLQQQPSVTHHQSIIPHHMGPHVSIQTSTTVASHHSNMIAASQIPNDQMQHSDHGMTTTHLSRMVTPQLPPGQIPTSYVTVSDLPNNQSCLPQLPHITHQNIQQHQNTIYSGAIQGRENVSSTNFPVVSDSVNVSSTDFFSNSITHPNRTRPQASVAPQVIQLQDSNLVTEKPYESNPVRLPFSERPGGSVTRNVATVAPVTTVNITTSTSVASSRMDTSTTHTDNSVPRVATVRPRPTYSYRAAMKDKNLSRDKIELTRIKPLEHVPLSKSPKNVKSDSESDSDGEKNSPNAENESKESEEKTQSYKLVMRKDSRTRTGFNVLPISGPSIPITSPEVKELRIKAKVSVGPKRKKAKNIEKDDILFIDKEKNCDILLNETFPNVSENVQQQQQANLPRGQDDTSLFDTSGTHSTEPYIVFELTSDDGFHVESRHISEVWQKVFDAVGAARANMRTHDKVTRGFQPSVGSPISGLHMLGLTHNAVQYLLEQLPGAKDCHKYSFQFHRRPQEEGEVEENLTGCARTESFKCRSPYDIFSWLASKHRRIPEQAVSNQEEIQLSTRRATSLELPMAMRYRHLRETAREAVGVFRSEIHGRGLFCKRDIDSGEMVIEYAGQVIRSSLCDNREKYYESKGIGCYMFRIDDDTVIDATMNGNAARFINHSCDPNCYSRVVDILGKKHIIIFALRRILQAEELTYDYKFPIEDDKIPCTCGNRRCRKYLN